MYLSHNSTQCAFFIFVSVKTYIFNIIAYIFPSAIVGVIFVKKIEEIIFIDINGQNI